MYLKPSITIGSLGEYRLSRGDKLEAIFWPETKLLEVFPSLWINSSFKRVNSFQSSWEFFPFPGHSENVRAINQNTGEEIICFDGSSLQLKERIK